MSAVEKPHWVTQDEYLQQYANDPNQCWELIDGQVYAQAGASRKHNKIAINLATAFHNHLNSHLKNQPCQPYMSDLRVTIAENGNFYYPDVVVDCGDDDYTADKPVLIIEVMSKSTAFLDKTKKLWEYAQIEGLQEYATVEQDEKKVTVYRRDNDWQDEVFVSGMVNFESIDLSLSIDEIYDRVFG